MKPRTYIAVTVVAVIGILYLLGIDGIIKLGLILTFGPVVLGLLAMIAIVVGAVVVAPSPNND